MLPGRVARVAVVTSVVMCVAGAGGPIGLVRAADSKEAESSSDEVVAVRGRVICLDARAGASAASTAPESDPCNQPGARFELHASSGKLVRFVAGDPRTDIFTDPQVRDREVEVRGWRRPGASDAAAAEEAADALEILSVYAVKDGALHHLHYRCDVCNITTYAPGPCWCCGQPFELREGPAGGEAPEGQ